MEAIKEVLNKLLECLIAIEFGLFVIPAIIVIAIILIVKKIYRKIRELEL